MAGLNLGAVFLSDLAVQGAFISCGSRKGECRSPHKEGKEVMQVLNGVVRSDGRYQGIMKRLRGLASLLGILAITLLLPSSPSFAASEVCIVDDAGANDEVGQKCYVLLSKRLPPLKYPVVV